MAGRLLSLHTSPTFLSSNFTTTRNASNSGFFFSPVRVTIPSSRPLQLERRHRKLVPVPRAGGPPSTNTLLFAFFMPLSLVLGTVLASLRISKQLDDQYFDEFEKNLAIMEENGMLEGEGKFEKFKEIAEVLKKKELVTETQARSRPKREL
ncbi:FACT complex subunit POB3 [Rhynchospora pubera]|uniref:FACT complex subunit POB3 n=1 Tax=Rhynchospora pubera TaxID=906938 RepID=A0AAV8E2Z5_9POAL|nr:FACT complex subunit POB3 [Rhynchospora pubera]